MGALIGAIFARGLGALAVGDGRGLLELALGLGFGLGRVLDGEGIDDGARAVALDEPRSRAAEDVADCRDGELPRGEQGGSILT
jgi:hypothetical protein